MSNPYHDVRERARSYITARGLALEHTLGYGKDGIVYSSNRATAVKVFHSVEPFSSERDCYHRLREMRVEEILGHHVPQMLAFDETLWIVEMTIVKAPYLLDFAGAKLDMEPEFPPEVLEEWERTRMEEFGPRWGHVLLLMEVMKEQFGIYLVDVHPRNITF